MVCVGRNYAAHARELSNEVPTAPFFFLKPASSAVGAPGPIVVPRGADAQHEVELAVEFGDALHRVSALDAERAAFDAVRGYRVAVDVTARAWQSQAKAGGLPWTRAKGAHTFLPLGDLVSRDDALAALGGDVARAEIWLRVNGRDRQRDSLLHMVFGIPQLIAHVTSFMRLEPGDLLLTGTPSGVAEIKPGDVVEFGGLGRAYRFDCVGE